MGGTHSLVRDEPGLFRVNRRAFVDESVLKEEHRKIFDRCWLYAGFETEVSSPGSFVTRNIGGRPILLVRDRAGYVRLFLNACTHRGASVCRERSGNASRFTCFYHGWSFSNSGDLIGLPDAEAYTPAFDRSKMGLREVPRMEIYRGLIFLSYDPNIVDLTSYLGAAREYIDYMLDFGGDDLEVAQGAQSYSMHANWKLLVENSMDVFHGSSVHSRFYSQYLPDMGVSPKTWQAWSAEKHGRGLSLGNGHAVAETPVRGGAMSKLAAGHLAKVRAGLVEKFGEDRAARIADYGRNLFIFPNLIFVSTWRTIRTFYPVSPDFMEIDAWALLPRNEGDEIRKMRLDNFISFLGPAGFGTPDDSIALEGCQRGFGRPTDEDWTDLSRGMGRTPHAFDEAQMRAFWRRWADLLSGALPDAAGSYEDRPYHIEQEHRI